MPKYIASVVGDFRLLLDDVIIENVQSVTAPDITRMMAEVKGAGILGTMRIPVPGHVEAMDLTVEISRAGKQKGLLTSGEEHKIEIRIGENIRMSDGRLVPEGTKIFANGYSKNLPGGKVEAGATRGESYTFALNRYREVVDGQEITLIDQAGGVFKVGGQDEMAAINKLL